MNEQWVGVRPLGFALVAGFVVRTDGAHAEIALNGRTPTDTAGDSGPLSLTLVRRLPLQLHIHSAALAFPQVFEVLVVFEANQVVFVI